MMLNRLAICNLHCCSRGAQRVLWLRIFLIKFHSVRHLTFPLQTKQTNANLNKLKSSSLASEYKTDSEDSIIGKQKETN